MEGKIYISRDNDDTGIYTAEFTYDKDLISIVKNTGHGQWNGRYWMLSAQGVMALIEDHKDNLDLTDIDMTELQVDFDNKPKPGIIYIKKCFDGYCARFEYDTDLIDKVKTYGHGTWYPAKKYWKLNPTNVLNLLNNCEDICDINDDLLTEIKEKDASIKSEEAKTAKVLQEKKDFIRKQKESLVEANDNYWSTPAAERLSNIKPAVDYSFKSNPYPHQIEAFNYILAWKNILVADEPGLGKTAESIYASDYLRKAGKVKKCLIICGVNTIKYNWLDEIKIHSDEDAILIEGTEQKRLEFINKWKNSDVYYGIINIEALRKDSIFAALNRVADCIICDEIHKAKNGRSQQGSALRALNAPYKIGLTGTPIDNKVEDLYNILSWLGVEKRSFSKFRDTYCKLDRWHSVVGYKNLGQLKKELSTVMIRRKKSDVVDLPEKIYKTEYVDLSKAEKKKYRELQAGILNNIDKILDMDNPLSSIFHLREVTGGLYTDEKDNAKLTRIKEIIEEEIIPARKKVIVFSKYEEITKIYMQALSDYHPAYITGTVDPSVRQKEVERFQNDPECRVCIGTIGAMGTGITLTAASTVIFADKDWTLSSNRQAEDRAHRIGTKENVNVITIVAKGTIDEYVETILQDKELYTDLIMEGTDVMMNKLKRPQLIADLLGISADELNDMVKKAQKSRITTISSFKKNDAASVRTA